MAKSLYKVPFFKKEIVIGKIFQNKNEFIIYMIIFLLLIAAVYVFSGMVHAENKANSKQISIIIETNDGWQSPKGALLITHMGGKYFIYNSSYGNSTSEIFIIEDAQVIKATLPSAQPSGTFLRDIMAIFNPNFAYPR